MSALKAAAVESALSSKGFEVQNGKHRVFRLVVNGQQTSIVTHTSHNQQEIHDMLLGLMAGQVKLPKSDFRRLIECSMSGDEYLKRMINEGFVIPPGEAPAAAKKPHKVPRRRK